MNKSILSEQAQIKGPSPDRRSGSSLPNRQFSVLLHIDIVMLRNFGHKNLDITILSDI